MSEVVIAESIDNTNDEQIYKYTIDMIDVNTILFNIMNTNTGINYKLHIKKDSEWCNENLYKIQNDFSQLYQMLNDCVNDEDSMFKYTLKEEKEYINFKMEMKNDTKFFKLDLEFKLDRHISENGIIDDRLNSIEYQFNIYKDKTNDTISKLQEDNELLKKQVSELIEFKNLLKEKNKKEIDWLNKELLGTAAVTNRNYNHNLLSGRESVEWQQLCNELPDDALLENVSLSNSNPPKYDNKIIIHDLIKKAPTHNGDFNKMFKFWFEHHMETLDI